MKKVRISTISIPVFPDHILIPNFLIVDKKANKSELIKGFKITTHFLTKFANSIDKILPFTRSNFMDNILNK